MQRTAAWSRIYFVLATAVPRLERMRCPSANFADASNVDTSDTDQHGNSHPETSILARERVTQG